MSVLIFLGIVSVIIIAGIATIISTLLQWKRQPNPNAIASNENVAVPLSSPASTLTSSEVGQIP
jgi:hypothetical protein